MAIEEIRWLRQFEDEHRKLKQLVADLTRQAKAALAERKSQGSSLKAQESSLKVER